MQADYAILCPMQEELDAILLEIKNIKAPKIEVKGKEFDDFAFLNHHYTQDFVSNVFIYRNEKDKNPIKVLISKIGVGRAASSYNFGKIEAIEVIEDWKLGFNLGNAVKYISRCEHKGTKEQDIKKAIWYLERELKKINAI